MAIRNHKKTTKTMTEQELLKKIGTLTTPEHLLECAKAYADARESKEIAELRDQLRIETDLKKVYSKACVESGKVIEARDTEIAELKAESKYWNERWEAGNKFQDAAFKSEIENYHEVKRLNAEIKRLRDALERVMRHHIDESMSILDNYLEMKDIARVAWKASISPAPVTETTTEFRLRNLPQDTTNVLPKNEDQE